MEAENNTNNGFHTAGAPPGYWLTRFMILRLLGVVYAVGFLVAWN